MDIAKYLLSIEEFMDTNKGEALLERASLRVDEERRRKAEDMKTLSGKAACLGAGLLLQFAVEEALRGGGGFESGGEVGVCGEFAESGTAAGGGEFGAFGEFAESGTVEGGGEFGACGEFAEGGATAGGGEVGACGEFAESGTVEGGREFAEGGVAAGGGEFAEDGVTADGKGVLVDDIAMTRRKLKICSVTELLDYGRDASVRQFAYRYGIQGKPYFRNLPFYFNLSHSGSYVLCGLSMEEIGADIQQHCGKDVGKLGRRFYSKRESDALEQAGAEREKLFYRLWARKEAYGKLTGEGIGKALGVDLLPETIRADKGEIYYTPSYSSQALISGAASLPEGTHLVWEEWESVEGYSIAFCRYR
ncbi:MAG TPA: hypothetical protein DCZ91_00585 [Lachnospiraceae bacterium]|nr:hypothetical protein [Lachnospiraceae bacterium]